MYSLHVVEIKGEWIIFSDNLPIGHIERKLKPSVFGGAWMNYIYINNKKKGVTVTHPSRLTHNKLLRFI
jgi:hypothetical protein